jgi:glycosyltransferase involved in cell wall biosynthesis
MLSEPINPLKLSVVLPCYNPLPGWKETVLENTVWLQSVSNSFELIIVNDGSTKNFDIESVAEFFKVIPNVKVLTYQENRGKGFALRHGVSQCSGESVIYTDIDFPYTKSSFVDVLELLKSNDLVIGIRSESYYTHLPAARVRISKFLRMLIRKLLKIPTDDTQCGLKGFNKNVTPIFLRTSIDRYLFDLEFIFLSAREKIKIKTQEVNLREDVQLSTMRWDVLLEEGYNFLKIFIKSIFNR